MTGQINNIIVVDVDFKKPGKWEQDGMNDFRNNYANLFGMPKTRIIGTRRGGYLFISITNQEITFLNQLFISIVQLKHVIDIHQ